MMACSPSVEPPTTTGGGIGSGRAVDIESVLDGDSVRVIAASGSIEIRLLGINAPERGECWSDEARTALTDALAAGDISMVGEEEDQYGRLLAYLFSNTTNVNRRLVLDGNAIAIAVEHDELPDFLAAEEEAIALERGLWNHAVCGSTADRFDVQIWTIEPDAPGRDDQRLAEDSSQRSMRRPYKPGQLFAEVVSVLAQRYAQHAAGRERTFDLPEELGRVETVQL